VTRIEHHIITGVSLILLEGLYPADFRSNLIKHT